MKNILPQYSDAKARIKYLKQAIQKLEKRVEKLRNTECVYDSVIRGKKGSKPLGRITIKGAPSTRLEQLYTVLKQRENVLEKEEKELETMTAGVEEYITGIQDVEIRNICSLYHVEDLNWTQVAHRMNSLYSKRKTYTEGSCRLKYERYLKKF